MAPRVLSVNVGTPRTVEWRGNPIETAIWKEPVDGRVRLEGVNLAGDDQADRRVHGGPDKAVYAYAAEDYEWWRSELGSVEPAAFGENLTTTGIDLGASLIGDRWQVGSAVLEVSQPRSPCFKLGIRMSDSDFLLRFIESRRPGAYLRIIEPGEIGAGDPIVVESARLPAIALASLVGNDLPTDILRLAAADERVPSGWRRSAARELESRAG